MRTRSQTTTTASIAATALNHDTLRTIFTSLGAADLQAALRTCKAWAALAADDALWRASAHDTTVDEMQL